MGLIDIWDYNNLQALQFLLSLYNILEQSLILFPIKDPINLILYILYLIWRTDQVLEDRFYKIKKDSVFVNNYKLN